MEQELDLDALAAAIDTIYGALGDIEDELNDVENDMDDDWDDDWSTLVPDEEDDMAEGLEDIEMVDESVRRKRVVRGGKKVIKYKTNKPGYRVAYVNGHPREVRIKPQEHRKRKRAQRRAARKRRAKKAQIARKRKISNRKRTSSMNRQSRRGK